MNKKFVFIILVVVLLCAIIAIFLFKEPASFQGCSNMDCHELIVNSKETEKTLDILFIPANIHYGGTMENYIENSEEPLKTYDQTQFRKDIDEIIKMLFSIPPYNQYQTKFNFYYYTKNAKCYISESNVVCEINEKPLSSISRYLKEVGYFDLYVVVEPGEGGGSSGTVIYSKSTPLSVVHEISHIIGNLYDETLGYSMMEKAYNICSDYSCCGGRLCESGETGECCIQTNVGSLAYTVPYNTVMKYGLKMGPKFSTASVKILDYVLKNWKDCYEFTYDPDLGKEFYSSGCWRIPSLKELS